MIASRSWILGLRMTLGFVFLLQVSACRKAEEISASGFESRSVLQLHPSPLTGEIDWNRSLALLENEDFLKEVAGKLGCDLADVNEALRFEVDVKARKLRLLAHHEIEERALEMVETFAEVFMEARRQEEVVQAQAQLDDLNRELVEQSKLVIEQREKLQGLVEKYEIPHREEAVQETLEQDRLTYEKARRVLAEEASDLESGILFQKDGEE